MSALATQALAEGALGQALLHIERADLAGAHPLLQEAVTGGVSIGSNASLYHGAPALEFVLGRAGRVDRDVQAGVDRVVTARLAAARRRQQEGRLPSLAEFDLISGLTGLGTLLLARTGSSPLLEEVLTYLVSLARPVKIDNRTLPGWWSPDTPRHQVEVPGGHGNNGIAHGIAGPLALLALAARRSFHVEGQREAIRTFATWLEKFGGSYWITLDQLAADEPPQVLPLRPSWCYGDLGIARALQLAALALCDPARRQKAEEMALAALLDADRLGRVCDASLCHGWAGILTVTTAIAADSATPGRFTASIQHIRQRLAAGLGDLSKPGFLEGRAGAQLALEGSNLTGWTCALLIH
ncbi:lanthionine synthetase C family protein [Nonomuraea ceibae]|uniref:lanthionine synthetase C family protein n=1 Tax=Nonomuraea ceibae TaxID=1935170 RepID=UPI001C6018D4|nr:lanthionine synthetase C family protein [Nonomuraea ceibae]